MIGSLEDVMNSSRIWLGRHNEEFAKSLPAGSIVLDAGAGSQPYRHLFGHCIYEAADFEMVDKEYAKSTYVCDLSNIPVAEARFDAIVLNQVLEHLSDPVAVLHEMHRVLKNGGTMICSAPLFYEEHEQPYDFFRYTQFAWRHLLGNAGFEIISLDWMEGYLGTVAYQMETASKHLPRDAKNIAPGALGVAAVPLLASVRIACRHLARIFYRLDARQKYTQSGFPKNYIVVAKKAFVVAQAA
ncbi:SAM-dependent methyltransferase [Rhizobium leguminosarum]|uniref:class I SAM-dependent methyltransferase n=1 Tax=Rhizobium leguminosarum TaxID=384 RepID=UPI0024B39794|nr:class I SAM-dependent methyltransferase [Rhizobium leguminosarum]WHO84298.1 class I SAM-dependent methyltransferase [Rhizobium leguminosarum]